MNSNICLQANPATSQKKYTPSPAAVEESKEERVSRLYASPGGPLIGWLFDECRRRRQEYREMAACLGVTYGYVNQLRSGLRQARHISDDFAVSCAHYLGVPPVVVKMVAGRIPMSDFVTPREPEEDALDRAMAQMLDDPVARRNLPADMTELTPDEFRLINPNTRTCPVFRSQRDAELTKKLYRAAPVLIREAEWVGEGKDVRLIAPEVNPWGIRFSTMFHMSNDSHLFADSLTEAHASAPAPRRLPLYEAKMVHQFDHRWATYVNNPDKPGGLDTNDVSPAQKADPHFTVRPRYWVDEREVLARIARVPSRVANAWLAWQQAADAAQHNGSGSAAATALHERHTALTLALATWVAGALFRTEADRLHATHPAPSAAPDTGSLFAEYEPNRALAHAQKAQAAINIGVEANAARWSNTTVLRATEATERLLASHHPLLAEALKADGTSGKKALPLFPKWALQDTPSQGLSLDTDELAHLQALQTPGTIRLALDWLDGWMDRRSPRWLMGWRRNARSTDERTTIATVMPRSAQGDSMFLWNCAPTITVCEQAALLANFVTTPFDFVARQKVGGVNFSFYFMKQLPVLPPDRYTPADLAYIVPRVLELTHTAHDMQAWADDLLAAMPSADPRPPEQHGTPLPPFSWNPERRAQLRAELDAYYARLYGLTRDELRYILDPADVMGADYPSETFRVLKNNEMREFGEYRTQRLVLAAWDQMNSH